LWLLSAASYKSYSIIATQTPSVAIKLPNKFMGTPICKTSNLSAWDLLLLKMQNLRDQEVEIAALIELAISKCDEHLVMQLREKLEKIMQVKSKLRNALR
jgi:hypothetical protein